MTVRGVVFDLDHTLFDRYATLDAISFAMIEEKRDILNPALTREELSKRIIEADATCILYGWQKVFERLYEQGTFREGTTAEDYLQYMLNDAFFRYAVHLAYIKLCYESVFYYFVHRAQSRRVFRRKHKSTRISVYAVAQRGSE